MVLIRIARGGAAVAAIWYAGAGFHETSSDTLARFFSAFKGDEQVTPTEANAIAEIFDELTLTAYGANVIVNTKATNSTTRVRDDGIDVPNTIVTITALTTGWFEVIGISEVMAINSLVNLEQEGTAAGGLRCHQTLMRLNL